MTAPLILASGSAVRAQLLRAAGLDFAIVRPPVDEEAIKASLRAEGLSGRDQADALAEAKCLSVAVRHQGFVIGADQMLACDGELFDKPLNRNAARESLKKLRGRPHHLIGAVCLAKDGAVVWRHIEAPRLMMRPFSDAFLETYLDQVGEGATASVGAYQLEALGAQLFSKIEGDYFSILGLPLLPLLAQLREHGLVPS
ncbi:MAG: Maf family protein [Alphaproteobacteria bacterium]|jgi:septum formation protein|nr:Maf family protein [Alphaproteobacteria bacterium]